LKVGKDSQSLPPVRHDANRRRSRHQIHPGFDNQGDKIMTHTKTTIAAIFAAALIGGLSMNPAQAAVQRHNWSDLSSVTNAGAPKADTVRIGHTSKEFSRDDLSAVTHRSAPEGVKPMVKATGSMYSHNDITAITHHFH
jgi:hypothetical protein